MAKLSISIVTLAATAIAIATAYRHNHPWRASHHAFRPRIRGGEEALPSEFPFLVYILLGLSGRKFICAGSLIDPDIVLTAAHCLTESPQSYTVVAGDHDRAVPEYPEEIRQVHDYEIHEYFDKNKINVFDIALIQVHPPFTMTREVNTVNLAPFLFSPPRTAVAMGWGRTESGSLSNTLMKLTVPIVELENCPVFPIDGLCYGGVNGKGLCEGDSGSPLICYIPYQVQCGIASVVDRDCFGGRPDVYTDVSRYLDWIEEAKERFDRPPVG